MIRELDTTGNEMLAAARSGEERAFRQLVEEMRGSLRKLVFDLLDSKTLIKEDASDVVQDCLVKAWEHLDDFRGVSVAEFQAWLVMIGRNTSKDRNRFYRRKQRDINRERQIRPNSTSGIPILSDEDSSGVARRVDAVWNALNQLPERQREAVRLQKFESWTLNQIAERLGCSDTAVQGLLRRGKSELARMLGEFNEQ